MTIETGTGKVFEGKILSGMLHGSSCVLIEVAADRPIAEIAADFEGVDRFVRSDADQPGITAAYEGFTQLYSVLRTGGGSVRLTLIKA